MSKKFIGFTLDPLRPINLDDKRKWERQGESRSYKLVSPDLDTDRQFATAQVKVTKAYSIEERLYIAGVANANIVDRVQERLDPVGLIAQDYLKNPQLLAHHSYHHPIGQVETIDVQDDGVHFSAWIGDPQKADLTDMQREIRSLVAQGILKTVSVGFIPKKIRAPLYNSTGIMEEPAVIEQWELLELSVVSVPCNQDSVFQMRGFESEYTGAKVFRDTSKHKSLNDTLAQLKKELAESSRVVQTLSLDKSLFTKAASVEWAQTYGFEFDMIDETDTSFHLIQDDNVEFDESTIERHAVTEGVKLVTVQARRKEGTPVVDAAATGDAAPVDATESMVLLRGISETIKQVAQMCTTIMQKLDAEAQEDANEDATETPPPKKDDPKPDMEKALNARVTSMEKSLERVTEALVKIATKLK
jgi:HK97 family phage prohead protease